MYIGVMSFYEPNKRDTEALMIKKAAIAMGHKSIVFRHSNCQLVFDNHHPRVLYKGKKFPQFDVVIPRSSKVSNNDLEASVIKQLQLMEIPVLNSYSAIVRSKNKLRTLQILDHLQIPIPKTAVVRRMEYLKDAIAKVGGLPVIIKTPFGSLGSGVAIVESMRSLYSALDIIWGTSNIILIQEYIKESKGKDIRAFVINGKVVAAMERKARKGDFRSNIGQGGTGRKVTLTKDEEKLAINATKALELNYSGVDIIRNNSHAMIMEVNCNPGLKGIIEATKINIPQELVKGAIAFTKKYK
ncbi:MAG: RimK family alpha-L-glutamate ligase [Candidatus Gracilibacteria bacterium]|nr:RimK family alpha-L-glutamate ligase [Candidatus Gracilibacteria bacterium]